MITYARLLADYGPGTIVPVRRDEHGKLRPPVITSRAVETKIRPHDDFQVVVTAAEQSGLKEGDLMPFSYILTTEGANLNKQVFVADELRKKDVYESPIGEAMDQDHGQGFKDICGDIYASEFLSDGVKHPTTGAMLDAVQCHAYIFQNHYPEVAYKVRRGAGTWAAVSMEAWPNPLEEIGPYSVIHDPVFIGAGLVRFPGNVHSRITRVNDEKQEILKVRAASLSEMRQSMRSLLQPTSPKVNVLKEGLRLLLQ